MTTTDLGNFDVTPAAAAIVAIIDAADAAGELGAVDTSEFEAIADSQNPGHLALQMAVLCVLTGRHAYGSDEGFRDALAASITYTFEQHSTPEETP